MTGKTSRFPSGESTQGYPDLRGYAWYRFSIQVPDGSKPLALLLPGIITGYQVFANDRLIGGEGSIAPNRNQVFASLAATYPLPQGSTGPMPIQIAIRVWYDTEFGLAGGMMEPGSIAGQPVVLARELTRKRNARTVDAVALYGYCLLASLVASPLWSCFSRASRIVSISGSRSCFSPTAPERQST